MNLSVVSINRPVLATVLSLVILIFGGISFFSLGVREFPSVDPPIVTVTTNYTGANADVIDAQVTEPLEESINGISGIRSLTSSSSDGRSTITVEFELEVDMETAANDVRDRVSRALRNLPPDIEPPIVAKSDADASPILAVTVQSDERSLLELTELGNNMFKERLQTVPGVSEIRVWGEKKYSMRLYLDPVKMAAYNLSPLDVRNALDRENVELPTGKIEGYGIELTIRTSGRLNTEEEFNNLIVREEEGAVVRLSQIGYARLAPENERTLLRGNGGLPMIGVAVTPQPGSNYIVIADEIYKRVEQIKKDLPEDVLVGYALDSTVPIRHAVTEVQETIYIAFFLVVMVILFFLRNWRTTLIPVIAIPVSLIGAFFIMYIAGFSINILTLLGVVLATGIVVDDAIVMMENIYGKIERGMAPRKAGIEGATEIFFAIISTTITLVAVFLPVIFLQGLTGRLFREFGFVVAGAVVISAFVSLSLTPMLSSKWLKPSESKTPKMFRKLNLWYDKKLTNFLKNRRIAVVVVIIAGGMIFLFGSILPSELSPLDDKSNLRIMATGPEGTSFERMDIYQRELIDIVDTLPEKLAIISVTSPGFGASTSANSGFIRIRLSDPGDRERSQQELADILSKEVRKHNFARAFVVQEQTIGGGRGSGLPVQFVIQATGLDKLREYLPKFMEAAQADPAFEVVDLNLKFNKPELRIEIDRDRANDLDVHVVDIAQTLQAYYSGQRFGFFMKDGKQYQIIGQASRENRDEPGDLSKVYVRNRSGELVRMDNVVRFETQNNPPQLFRYNRYVSATISASPAEGVTLGQGIEAMDEIASEVLDESFTTALAGTSKEYMESSNSLVFAFLFALILVYLVLSAQFESFRDPVIIMVTVPLALAGALLSLWLFGQTMNIFSQIGIIVLVGIVTKNGILIVEFANQRKEAGLDKFRAVKEAAVSRLRPILMTSLATALGALPIALALGGAAQSRVSMGIVIIGGLIFSLVLTLFVIPALYTYLSADIKPKATEE